MSSRALRRLQKQREVEQQAIDERDNEEISSEDGDSPMQPKASGFAMLAEVETEDDEDNDGDHADERAGITEDIERGNESGSDGTHIPQTSSRTENMPSTAEVKKRKKRKSRKPVTPSTGTNADEIDAALKSLESFKNLSVSNRTDTDPSASGNEFSIKQRCAVLAIDTHHLQVGNEMRRLFGKAAFEAEQDENAQARSRRPHDDGDQFGLAEAVAGRNSHAGAGLPQMIRRRNVFVQGKEEWPKASGGGLGMDIVETDASGIIEYTFVHNKQYQSAQQEFDTCVLTMDPNLMVNLLRFVPYHVALLLQVSEIAKQERDHTTSGDLLERALFAFGRATHPSFAASLAEGKARLDFRRPENREFFLAAWRYITNISMRATWRTVYEWAKLLLSLSPEEDPYQICLVIDQFALRARQAQSFLNLAENDFFRMSWARLPNISFSRALAMQASSESKSASSQLVTAIEQYPWIAASLFRTLDIAKIPPSIWGATPPENSTTAILYSTLYTTRGIDLWKTNEVKEFLKSAALQAKPSAETTIADDQPISQNQARHVILTDKPELIALLPHKLTSSIGSASDPLPPEDNIKSYTTGVSEQHRTHSVADPREMVQNRPGAFVNEIAELHQILGHIVPGFNRALARRNTGEATWGLSQEDIDRAVESSGLAPQVLSQLLGRIQDLREVLFEQPERSVLGDDHVRASLSETGVLRLWNVTLDVEIVQDGGDRASGEDEDVDGEEEEEEEEEEEDRPV